jgi:hypothetical protein
VTLGGLRETKGALRGGSSVSFKWENLLIPTKCSKIIRWEGTASEYSSCFIQHSLWYTRLSGMVRCQDLYRLCNLLSEVMSL